MASLFFASYAGYTVVLHNSLEDSREKLDLAVKDYNDFKKQILATQWVRNYVLNISIADKNAISNELSKFSPTEESLMNTNTTLPDSAFKSDVKGVGKIL